VWYAIYARDREDSLAARLENRAAHVQRLKDLNAQGRLLLAGPLPAIDNEDPGPAGFLGSLIVAEFRSIEDAHRWADQDPYRAGGVYQEVRVTPFKRVLPL